MNLNLDEPHCAVSLLDFEVCTRVIRAIVFEKQFMLELNPAHSYFHVSNLSFPSYPLYLVRLVVLCIVFPSSRNLRVVSHAAMSEHQSITEKG